MKLGMNVMPLKATPNILISCAVSNNNIADAQMCEVRATPTPLDNDAW
jgi:hypothetical protein